MTDLVILSTHNTPVTTSLVVAKAFGKRHDNVLRAIQTLAAEAINGGAALKIEGSSYRGEDGAEAPLFIMDEEAFSLLVMGFTGAQALEWKRKFYAAFKALRDKLVPSDPIKLIEYTLAKLKEETAARQKAEATIKRASAVFQDHLLPAHKAQKLIADSKEFYTAREASKTVGMGQKNFIRWLEDNKWVYRNRDNDIIPYQDKINAGLIAYKFFDYETTMEYYDHPRPGYRAQTMITSSGLEHISRMLTSEARQ
jgi:anti-repressor protein